MDWIELTVFTTAEGIEPVTGRLYRLGVSGVEIEDKQEFEEFYENNRQYWDYLDEDLVKRMSGETKVKAYIEKNAEGFELLNAIRDSLKELSAMDDEKLFGRLGISLSSLSEEDWANNWKQYFKPIPVGEKLLICPEWEEPPAQSKGRIVFRVDPGMTFGTGAHETTRLCLRALEKAVTPGCSMLDLGCGSGILSIVSMLLGASFAVAADIDPNAKKIAMENARRNGLGEDRYTVYSGDLTANPKLREKIAVRKYDVVAANIVADVIIALSPFIPALLAENGTFICSGILDERREEVEDALSGCGIRVAERWEEKGWAALSCRHSGETENQSK